MNLIARYWANVLSRGDKPANLFLVVSMGGVQPEGYIIGWSTSLKDARGMGAKMGGKWIVSKLQPVDLENAQ